MVELIVVISIITILIGLLIVGIGHLHNVAKRQQTQQTFQNLQGMFGDWDAVTRVPFSAWAMPCPMNVSIELNPPGAPSMAAQANDSSVGNRYGAVVWVMRDLMFNLKSVPNNAAAIAKMPADEIMVMPIDYNGSAGFPTGFAGGTPGAWSASTPYTPVGSSSSPYSITRISFPDPSINTVFDYYDCLQANEGNQPPNATYWLPAYPTFASSGQTPSDNSMPIPLDGWGNPIIFVPGGALGSGAALGGSMGSGNSVTPGSGALMAGGVSATIRSPDGRPFFASAGPDGDFSKGDDNLYSFER